MPRPELKKPPIFQGVAHNDEGWLKDFMTYLQWIGDEHIRMVSAPGYEDDKFAQYPYTKKSLPQKETVDRFCKALETMPNLSDCDDWALQKKSVSSVKSRDGHNCTWIEYELAWYGKYMRDDEKRNFMMGVMLTYGSCGTTPRQFVDDVNWLVLSRHRIGRFRRFLYNDFYGSEVFEAIRKYQGDRWRTERELEAAGNRSVNNGKDAG